MYNKSMEPIINSILSLWYLVPLFIFVGIIKTPWFKGVIGEILVNFMLRNFLSKNDYHLLKNVTLPTEDGTTQIDHILVSKYGVFVIETKNMKGWIFGSENQNQWTQKIYKYSGKFQNPIHQNYKHLKTLESCLGISQENIFSVIVFIGDSTFKTEMPENVTYARGCIRFIKGKNDVVFTSEQVLEVVTGIEEGRLVRSLKTNRDHVAHVKSIVSNKRKICSKCGALMIARESKRGKNIGGKFWGCSSFPRCRNVESVT